MARAPKLEIERPPHDALDGVPLPRQTTTLLGHRAAEQTILDAYRSGRMHHAWIITGDRGTGRATLAFRLARFLFAHPDPLASGVAAATDLSVAEDNAASRRLSAGTHPNVMHVQREWDEKRKRFKSEISVDSIRHIIPFLGNTAGEEGWRVVIVDPADEMTRSAANAILKNLEEPPRRTVFLLIAKSRGALLPTILSRSRTLALDPLSPEETEAVVRNVAPAEAEQGGDRSLEAALAGGSPRRLIELRRSDGVALYRLMLAALERGDAQARLRLSARMADAAAMEQFFELFEGYLDRRVRSVPEPGRQAAPADLALVTFAELWDKATLSGREVETYNLDRRQFVLDLLEQSAAAFGRSGSANLR